MKKIKQHEIGVAGLAILRNWIIGDEKLNKKIINELIRLVNGKNKHLLYDSGSVKNYNLSEGYRLWSETYDSTPNLLLDVEEPIVKELLKKLPKGLSLDAACGTGRYSNFLNAVGHDVIGLDKSLDMLNVAKTKYPSIKFVEGNIKSLQFKNQCFNNVVCTLALTHFSNIKPVLREFNRVLCYGGFLILSDIHPPTCPFGWSSRFYDKNGNHGYITNYKHWHNEYLKCFEETGFEIVVCEEPVLKKEKLKIAKKGFYMSDETISAAFQDIPIALIWQLRKKQ